MITEGAAWAIFLLPLASFVIISLLIRPFYNRHARYSGYLTILAIGIAFALSLWALWSVWNWDDEGAIGWKAHPWLTIGSLEISVGLLMDPLTAIMVVVVSGVSLAVQVYSQGYMRDDPGYSRYFAFMSLFTASMLGLVLARNIIQLYVFWELVGLCSYLLIGFWYHRPAAAAAAKKAFLVTRLGDVGFLLAILYLFFNSDVFHPVFSAGSELWVAHGLKADAFDIPSINFAAKAGLLAGVATWIAVGMFAGAVGKSAQFPLHVWLPDAMEGPTPVSALIHAATMVVAGVFLVARFFPLFEASTTAMNIVAVIGGFTAIFAATMGLVMNDIKRVLAYSTVSQLGYMMMALGVGAYDAAIFHLFNHAFFKALMFLGAGSVNHASGTFDMRYMGGLRRHMPWTYTTFFIAALSISGIFPLAGFWSKDEILVGAFNHGGTIGSVVFWMALVAAFMTAFYAFRALFVTFHGEFRGGAGVEGGAQAAGHGVHLAESPWVMVVPMAVLAVPAAVSGFLANPLNAAWGLGLVPTHWLSELLGSVALVEVHPEGFSYFVALGSTVMALAGIGLAYLMYCTRLVDPARVAAALKPAYGAAYRKYFFDDLYEEWIVRRGFYRGLAQATDWADRNVVDRTGAGIAFLGRNAGRAIAQLETGQVQAYGAGISVGVLFIMVVFLLWH
ncbi:MAG: NADH-quinone oxidoreductase subunit L [Chloroflexi bacterium]|nr:NADH-quinone oxidoreductase subunit L [Chloroflexota bacterium]